MFPELDIVAKFIRFVKPTYLLYGCVRRAEKEMDLSVFKNMTQIKIIWHAIKGAYGQQFEVSDEAIFDNFEDANDAPS